MYYILNLKLELERFRKYDLWRGNFYPPMVFLRTENVMVLTTQTFLKTNIKIPPSTLEIQQKL
jgi:hypothetical protein